MTRPQTRSTTVPDPLIVELREGFASLRNDIARLRAEEDDTQRGVQAVAIVHTCADLTVTVVETVGVELDSSSAERRVLTMLFGLARDCAAHIGNLVRSGTQLDRAQALAGAVNRAMEALSISSHHAAMVLCSHDLEDRWLTRRVSARGVTLSDLAFGCGAWPWLLSRRGGHPMTDPWQSPPSRLHEQLDADDIAALASVVGDRTLRWLSCPGEELALLARCGLLTELDQAQRDTVACLAAEWTGTVDELLHAARSI